MKKTVLALALISSVAYSQQQPKQAAAQPQPPKNEVVKAPPKQGSETMQFIDADNKTVLELRQDGSIVLHGKEIAKDKSLGDVLTGYFKARNERLAKQAEAEAKAQAEAKAKQPEKK